MGVDCDGEREVLGIWWQETEAAKFWLAVLNDLHRRGVGDVLIACVDGLKGFPEAIEAVFPQTCIVHLIRASLRYVSYRDLEKIASALRPIYTIEGLHRQIRKGIKTRGAFPESATKLIYLAIIKADSRSQRSRTWSAPRAALKIHFGDRYTQFVGHPLRAAIGQVLGCPWQRCTVHFLRNMLGHCAKSQQPMISPAIRGIFAAGSGDEARERLAEVVERIEPVAPKAPSYCSTPKATCSPSTRSHASTGPSSAWTRRHRHVRRTPKERQSHGDTWSGATRKRGAEDCSLRRGAAVTTRAPAVRLKQARARQRARCPHPVLMRESGVPCLTPLHRHRSPNQATAHPTAAAAEHPASPGVCCEGFFNRDGAERAFCRGDRPALITWRAMGLRAFPVLYAKDVEAVARFYMHLGFEEHFRLPDGDG